MAIRDRRNHASRQALLRRVYSEFSEMPCLRLTRGQAQRLFSLRTDVCDRVLATLVRDGVLMRGADDRFRLNDTGTWTPRSMLVERTSVISPKAS